MPYCATDPFTRNSAELLLIEGYFSIMYHGGMEKSDEDLKNEQAQGYVGDSWGTCTAVAP